MTGRHVARPAKIKFRAGDEVIQLSPRAERLLGMFRDGVLSGVINNVPLSGFIKRGWATRTRGHYELTPRGREIYAAWVAYLDRKHTAVEEQQT